MADVRVSIVTVNYNAGAMLRDCVASAMTQCDQIIVVDNASADDSLATLSAAFPGCEKLHIIRNELNLGFARGCNIGVQAASGHFLLFLNPDCILEPMVVSRLVAALDGHDRAGMAGAVLVDPDGTEQGGGRRAVPTPWRSFVRAFGLSRLASRWPKLFFDFHLHEQPLPDHDIEVEAISGACMMVRRDAMEDVGLLDEGYFMHCEDLDWCMRFRSKGWKILFVPDTRIVHYKGECGRSRPVFVEWHKHKGMMRFYRKFFQHQYPGILMWFVAVGIWLRFALLVSRYALGRINQAVRRPWSEPEAAAREDHATRQSVTSMPSADRPWTGVLGASSLVGCGLLPLLVERGWQVAAFSRRPHKGLEVGPVAWLEPGKLLTGSPSIPAWICLAPIWVLPDYFDWLVECGAKHVVALSSTSRFTKVDSSDPVEQALACKFAACEDQLSAWAQAHGVAWTVLRPTLIYGFGQDSNVSEIARLIRRFGFFPLLGKAHGLRQPVHAQDLATACVAALGNPAAENRGFNLSGGEILPYREMVERVFIAMGKRPRFVSMPLWAFRSALVVLRIFPRFRKWSGAMAERMNRDLVFDHAEATQALGFSPRAFELTRDDLIA